MYMYGLKRYAVYMISLSLTILKHRPPVDGWSMDGAQKQEID